MPIRLGLPIKRRSCSPSNKHQTAPATRLPGTAITIARPFPARNDTDADGNALTVSAVASKSKNNEAITLNSTNIIYASASTNADWFSHTVSDGKGATATGTNHVNVSTNGVLVVY